MRSISFSLMLIAMVFCGSCEVENGDVETSSRYVGGEDAERVSMDDPLYAQLERAMTSIFWKGTEDFHCSGIAISPYHILTAAHCVIDDWGEEEDPGDFDFYFGPGFQQFKHPGSGIAIFLPPDIDMDKADPDIAIIWLEESINRENDPWIPDGGKGYISPSRWMTVYSENWDDYSFSYDEWTPVVFGYGNNTDYEISYSNGVLYRGIGGDISCCSYKPQIEDSYNPFVLANEEDEHYLNVFSEENYNWFIWDGDSGGPLFIKNPFKNEYRLAGIVSSGNRVTKTQTFTKVNDFRGWIFQTVYPKADPWNYYSEDTDGDWIMDSDPVETDIDGDGVLDGPDCNDYMVSLADDADRDGVCDHFEWFFNQHDYDVEIEATYGYKKCREELEYLRKRYNGIAGNRDWRDIGQLSGDPCKIDNCIRIPYTHEFNPPPLTWTGEEHIGSRNFEPLYYGAKETALLNHCYDDNFQPKSIGQAGQCIDLWRNSNQTDTDGDGIGDVCDTDVSYNDRRLYYKDQARLEDDIELIEFECLDECGSLGVLPEMTTVEGELTYFEWKTTGMQIEKEGNDYFRKSKIEEDLSALGICTCPEDMSKNQCMERDYPCYTNIANGYPSPDIPIPYWRRFETAELNSSYWQKMLDPRFAHSHTNEGTLILKPRFADPDHGFHINNVSWDPNDNADICNTGGFCKKGDWFGMRYVKGWDDINAIQSSWNKAYYNQNGQITGYDVEEEFKVNCVCGLNIKPFEMRQWPDFHIMPETRTRYVSRVNKVCIGNRINEIDDTAYTFSVRYDTITGRMNGSQSRPFAGYNISNTPADSFGTATGLLLVPPAQKTSDMDDNNANYSIFDEFKEQTGKGTEEIITMDFIFGGEKHNGALSGDLWASFSHPDINNEQFDRWIRIEPDDGVEGPKLRSPRTVYLQDINRLYVFGGWNSDNIWSHDIHYFDLDDMKWHEAGSLDISRLQTGYDVFYHQSKKKIIIFGGSFGDFPTLLAYNYMPSTGKTKMIYQWGIPGINMPWPRREPGVTLRELKDEIVLFGGKIGKEPIYKNDTWSLDLNTGLWERIDSHSINLPSPRANAVLMPGQGDNLHMVSGTHYGEMIFETAWTMGGRMKGWEKVPTSVKALVVNDENGVESNYTGKIEHSYRIAGIEHIDIDDMDIHDAEMIKVHLVEDGSNGDMDIEVMNQQGEVVARGADVTVGSMEKHPVASFLAVPGVQYTVRVVYNGYIPEGDYVYYKLVASGAQTDLRSTEFGFMTGGFDISNGYLFVTTAKGLHIYRIMDDGTLYGGQMGGKPMFIPMRMPQDVVADWPYAYVADLERGLMVVDMTRFETGDDPVISSINLGSHMCYSIDKYGDKLYLAMGWMGVYIADVSTPGSLKITGNKWLCDFAYRVNNYGSKLMVSSLIKGIQLLDIKASGRLKGISSYRTQGMALDAKGHGSNVYVNNFGPGIEIISLSDMEDLDNAGEYKGSSIPVDAQIWGNAAIVHIDGVGVASFELIDDLAAVPFYNN